MSGASLANETAVRRTCRGGTACSVPTAIRPGADHEGMTIGIEGFGAPAALHLGPSLVQPSAGARGNYPLNRRDPS